MSTVQVLHQPVGCDAQPGDRSADGRGEQAHRAYAISPDGDSLDGAHAVMLVEDGRVVRAVHCASLDEAIEEGEAWLRR